MKRIIVNADDFGLAKCVNEGIIFGYKHGIITSTTMLANSRIFEESIDLLKQNRGLGVGIHFNLSYGSPLCDKSKVASLLDNGRFVADTFEMGKKIVFGKIKPEEIELEFETQLAKILETGIKITHMDSHKHIHCFPVITKILMKISKKYKINCIRRVKEIDFFRNLIFNIGNREIIPGLFYLYSNRILDINTTDYFSGLFNTGKTTETVLINNLKKIPDNNSCEIMVHPGYVNEGLKKISRLSDSRKIELETLTSENVKKYIGLNNIKLINFSEIK